jgi:hypothetical protein
VHLSFASITIPFVSPKCFTCSRWFFRLQLPLLQPLPLCKPVLDAPLLPPDVLLSAVQEHTRLFRLLLLSSAPPALLLSAFSSTRVGIVISLVGTFQLTLKNRHLQGAGLRPSPQVSSGHLRRDHRHQRLRIKHCDYHSGQKPG